MFRPVFNPDIPFACKYDGVLREGMVITVCGQVLPHSQRFHVNLHHGDDIVLQVNPRYEKSYEYVVHNTRKNGSWGSEERKYEGPFPTGKPFALQIFVTLESYKISANGKPFSEYKHRIPFSQVDRICVSGMVEASLVDIQHLEPHYAPVPGPFNVPYKSIINGGLKQGKTIIIQGLINLHARRLEINLRHKTGIAFYYSCDVQKNVVVQNRYENGKWGQKTTSDQMPFETGKPFQVTICVDVNEYSVFASGRKVHTFNHRFTELQEIDVLEISGDLLLTFVQP
ncbi:Galectin-4 [Triplophysa tibetana]|uniref:Galectin n=1 Tax=Triplophysa tibetana TaxID=1572043 RepID=A0A5A9PND7_9TELE|nr:Galectin-4 [Triplophysa tibetana]